MLHSIALPDCPEGRFPIRVICCILLVLPDESRESICWNFLIHMRVPFTQWASVKSSNRMLKKSFYTGCSKTLGCKACEIMRNEAYFAVRRSDE